MPVSFRDYSIDELMARADPVPVNPHDYEFGETTRMRVDTHLAPREGFSPSPPKNRTFSIDDLIRGLETRHPEPEPHYIMGHDRIFTTLMTGVRRPSHITTLTADNTLISADSVNYSADQTHYTLAQLDALFGSTL